MDSTGFYDVGIVAWRRVLGCGRKTKYFDLARKALMVEIIETAILCKFLLLLRARLIAENYWDDPRPIRALEIGELVRLLRQNMDKKVFELRNTFRCMDELFKSVSDKYYHNEKQNILDQYKRRLRLKSKIARLDWFIDRRQRVAEKKLRIAQMMALVATLKKAIRKRQHEANRDAQRARRKAWLSRTRDVRRRQKKAWREKNWPKYIASKRASNHKRRARKRGVQIDQSANLFMRKKPQRAQCHWCGNITPRNLLCADHIVPLARGGHHSAYNLCWSCFDCNNRKSDQDPNQFAPSQLVLKF